MLIPLAAAVAAVAAAAVVVVAAAVAAAAAAAAGIYVLPLEVLACWVSFLDASASWRLGVVARGPSAYSSPFQIACLQTVGIDSG